MIPSERQPRPYWYFGPSFFSSRSISALSPLVPGPASPQKRLVAQAFPLHALLEVFAVEKLVFQEPRRRSGQGLVVRRVLRVAESVRHRAIALNAPT